MNRALRDTAAQVSFCSGMKIRGGKGAAMILRAAPRSQARKRAGIVDLEELSSGRGTGAIDRIRTGDPRHHKPVL